MLVDKRLERSYDRGVVQVCRIQGAGVAIVIIRQWLRWKQCRNAEEMRIPICTVEKQELKGLDDEKALGKGDDMISRTVGTGCVDDPRINIWRRALQLGALAA
jgi:hypothetical protein